MSGLRERLAGARGRLRGRAAPVASGAIAAAVLVLFAVVAVTGDTAPSSTLGLSFGVAAAVLLLLVMLYSVRRALPAVRSLGPTQRYLQVHLWGGGLFLLLFLLHTDFRAPAGGMATLLWLTSLWVVVTGGLGLLLQRAIPRVLEPASTFEVHLQRIPELVSQLRQRAEAAAARAEPRVRAYYEQQLAPEMAEPRANTAVLLRNPGSARRGTRDVDILKRTLPAEGVAAVDELRALHATKHEMDVHYTLQRMLRAWLYLHLPVAIVLLGLVALHVFLIVYF